MTFVFAHHVLFPLAAGILASLVTENRVSRRAKVILLLVSIVMCLGIVDDFFRVPIQPYMLPSPCRALDAEQALRVTHEELRELERQLANFGPNPNPPLAAAYNAKLNAYNAQKTAYVSRFESVSPLTANSVPVIAFGLNLLYTQLCTTFFWFSAVMLWPTREERFVSLYPPLLATWALLTLWIPCRVYADMYEHDFLNEQWPKHQPVFAAIISALVLIWIVYFFVRDAVSPKNAELFLACLGVAITILAFIPGTGIFKFVTDGLENMRLILYLIAMAATLVLLGAICSEIIKRSGADG